MSVFLSRWLWLAYTVTGVFAFGQVEDLDVAEILRFGKRDDRFIGDWRERAVLVEQRFCVEQVIEWIFGEDFDETVLCDGGCFDGELLEVREDLDPFAFAGFGRIS